MYRLLRNVHLFAGLFAAVFLLAFGLSAAQMAWTAIVPPQRVTEHEVSVPASVEATPRALARWLAETQDITGGLDNARAIDGGFTMLVSKVGRRWFVRYEADAHTAHIRLAEHYTALGMLNRVHHIRGTSSTYWALNAWGWFLAAVSAALLVLSVSGLVLWFQRHRERRAGLLVLAGGLIWGLTLLVLMRTA